MIGINGMGRIGRAVLRSLVDKNKISQLAAITDRNDPETIAQLLKHDTIYGKFPVPIELQKDRLVIHSKHSVEGHPVQYFRSERVNQWSEFGVDVVLECSGEDSVKKAVEYFREGAKVVIISAPAPNVDATLIFGVNHQNFNPEKHKIISMASCTMNCVAPIIMALKGIYKIKYLNLVSVNSYTNSQRLVDAPNIDMRLARAAAQNIIPSESSTKDTIGKIFPELEGKYSAKAFRVPVLCGSVSYLSMRLDKKPMGVNAVLAVSASALLSCDVMEYSDEPLVSSDIIGNPHSAVIDGRLTKVEGNNLHIVAWNDNEYGYASRLVDLASYVLGVLKR